MFDFGKKKLRKSSAIVRRLNSFILLQTWFRVSIKDQKHINSLKDFYCYPLDAC